jgi:hypothetical protein
VKPVLVTTLCVSLPTLLQLLEMLLDLLIGRIGWWGAGGCGNGRWSGWSIRCIDDQTDYNEHTDDGGGGNAGINLLFHHASPELVIGVW